MNRNKRGYKMTRKTKIKGGWRIHLYNAETRDSITYILRDYSRVEEIEEELITDNEVV